MTLRARKTVHDQQSNRIVTGPLVEPVTLDFFKAVLRISGTAEDAVLESMLLESRKEIERITGLAMITQTWELTRDHWPGMEDEPWWNGVVTGPRSMLNRNARLFEIPKFPLQSVESVRTYDEASNETEVTIADYFDIDTASWPGRVALQFGQIWPLAQRPTAAIKVQYIAGFGDDASDVPEPVKNATYRMASYLYQHRGDCATEDAFVKSGASTVMNRYGRRRL